jgi:outer membrane lipoprotein carrier protein
VSLTTPKNLTKTLRKTAFFAVLAIIGLRSASAQASITNQNLDSLLNAVDHHYDSLRSFRTNFEEIYRAEGVNRVESGTLWLKRGGKMRWEYTEPQPKLFVTDGHEAYFYASGDAEAQKSNLKRLDDLRSPLRYLLGKTRLRKEFDDLTIIAQEDEECTLQGIPRGMNDRVASVEFQITKGSDISAITIHGSDGSVTEFHFSNMASNPPVNDDMFRFIPPPGVQVVNSGEILQP